MKMSVLGQEWFQEFFGVLLLVVFNLSDGVVPYSAESGVKSVVVVLSVFI